MEFLHCAENDTAIKNIHLLRGPAVTWDGRSSGLSAYLQLLHPMIQTLNCLFRALLHDSWWKYVKARDLIPAKHLEDGCHEGLGILRGMSIVVGSITNGHRYSQDVFFGWWL